MAGVIPDRDAELLSAYLDGELSREELRRVSALLSDEHAIALFRELRETRTRLRLLPQLELPAYLAPDGHLGGRLSAYLDGELTTSEIHIVVSHLAQCSDCRSELRDLDGARTAVRSLPGVEPPNFVDAPRLAQRPPRRPARVAVAAGSIAAAAVLVVGIVSRDAPPPDVRLEDLASLHVARASAQPAFSVFPAIDDGGGP